MDNEKYKNGPAAFAPVEDRILVRALNELGRSINLITTYGKNHPAAKNAINSSAEAMDALFAERKNVSLGAFNGVLTIDEAMVLTTGTLQKSLERRLVRLRITGLRIARGITREELTQLAELLACNEADTFEAGIDGTGMEHIKTEKTRLQAVREGQTVTNKTGSSGVGGDGFLVLEDDEEDIPPAAERNNLHVEQIVAFLKGDIDSDSGDVGNELKEMASDPDRLGRMIMESVAIRQAASELAGESLNDIILGCLRRTYDGLRKQPAFQSSEGKAELKKSLLLLEESILDKMRGLAGEDDPEMDRQIVQAIREMDENLNFEVAAAEYMEHREALEENKQQLREFIQTQGSEAAENLLAGSGFPGTDWRRIVVESRKNEAGGTGMPFTSSLNTFATVFEKLEQLMKSKTADGSQVKDLLGQANENLDDTIDTTKEKLAALSQHLKDEDSGTIGGHAQHMTRNELLYALSEVAQELMQPLTAINTSLEMMLKGYVGEITGEQTDLLKLASNSGEHLKFLMNMLIDLVGCPTNKGVDSRFHTTSEQVVLMQDAVGQEHLPLNFQ